MKIGLIGIVGEELKEDPWGTLERLAEIGYEGVEGAAGIAGRAGVPLQEVKQKLDELGLGVPAQGRVRAHMDDEEIKENLRQALAVGADYAVDYWGPVESEEQLLEEAESFNRLGCLCAEEGLRFLYHNHNHEFATFDGRYALDILFENTDPQTVAFELDVAWVTYGGGDPATVISRYAGRCPVLHMKDFVEVPEGGDSSNDRGETHFTEVGTGVVDIEGAVAAARESGVEWLVVEQDRMRDLPPMESARVSHDNLRRILEAAG